MHFGCRTAAPLAHGTLACASGKYSRARGGMLAGPIVATVTTTVLCKCVKEKLMNSCAKLAHALHAFWQEAWAKWFTRSGSYL